MGARLYATLDQNRVGESLLLDQSLLVVVTGEACDIHRMILGTLPAYSGRFVYECYFWSQSRGDLSGLVSIGVAAVGADITQFVGESADSFGFRVPDGEIWNNNASIATVNSSAERVAISVILDLSPSSCTCDFLINGSSVYQATLPTGQGWLPAISIGSAEAGDISASVNFGQNRFDTLNDESGWYEQQTGLADITLSLVTDALLLTEDNSSATKVRYAPKLLNGKSLSIRREPKAWFQESSRAKPAAATTLRFDNSKSEFNELLAADIRDADVTLRTITGYSRGVCDEADATTVFTGVLENVTAPKVTEVEVSISDTLSRLDRPMRCRVVPPFRDATSVGKILPIGLGAQRNIQPLLLDGEEEGGLYALGDAPMSNVAAATDQAAPLDPYATPPQYRPASGGSEIILDSPPIGRFAVDCSSVGQQYVIPGDEDVLDGIGSFDTWDTSGQPEGWDIPTTPPFLSTVTDNGSIQHLSTTRHPSYLRILSFVPYNTNVFNYGYPVFTSATYIEPGATYNISFRLISTYGGRADDPTIKYGLAVLSSFEDSAQYWISPYKQPLTVPLGVERTYTFSYTVPRNAPSDLKVILSAVAQIGGTAPALLCIVDVDDVKVEKLGQYTIAPLEGISVKDAFTEILVNREKEDPSIFSASDCDAIDAATGYRLGFRYTDVPNVLQVLQDIADQVGAAIFTDAEGVIRIRRLTDPRNGTPSFALSEANVVSASVRQYSDDGKSFTTLVWARPNCVPFGAGDFVTDTETVPASVRAQYQGLAQYSIQSTVNVAHQYEASKSASRKLLRIDDPEQAQDEINRIAEDLFIEKAIYLTLDVLFDGNSVGLSSLKTPAHQIYYGDVCTISLAALGLSDTRAVVTATELFPTQGRINLTLRYIP